MEMRGIGYMAIGFMPAHYRTVIDGLLKSDLVQ
jgi:hypothetical protein